MKLRRRQLLAGVPALLLGVSGSGLVRAQGGAEAQATARLQVFLTKAIGLPASDRAAVARASLSDVNPMDPSTVLVELAAIGVLVRTSSLETSLREGYPRRSRESLNYASRALAGAAWTYALYGAWHLEVVRRSALGATVYGASRRKGEELFAKAIAMAPDDGGIGLSYAIALLSDEPADHGAQALGALTPAPRQLPGPYGAAVAKHTAQLRALLDRRAYEQAGRYAISIF